MPLPAAALDQLRQLLASGRTVAAWRQATTLAPWREWRSPEEMVLAGRILDAAGAHRLADAWFLRCGRLHRASGVALLWEVKSISDRRGPLAAWQRLQARMQSVDADAATRAELWSTHALILARLRDPDASEASMSRALAVDPGHAPVYVDHAAALLAADRLEVALEAARRGLELAAHSSRAVLVLVDVLHGLERDDEALTILTAAEGRSESGVLSANLAALFAESGDVHAEAAAVERYAARTPARDKESERWLALRRGDIAYGRGDFDAAVAAYESAKGPFATTIAANIRRAPQTAPVYRLAVPFVRQHHHTCGAATLVAIARALGHDVEHATVVDAIVYGGTTHETQRRWAREQGFIVREFTVDLASAQQLLAAGLPFAVSTREADSAHLQAVIGYDERRGIVFVRDPSDRCTREYLAAEFLARYRDSGPRGMVMAPPALAVDLQITDAELHDRNAAVEDALQALDVHLAQRLVDALVATHPDHHVTQEAQWSLAIYRQDTPAILATVERLRATHPDSDHLLLRALRCLREIGSATARRALLEPRCATPSPHPAVLLALARELLDDPLRSAEGRRCLRRALRRTRDPKALSEAAALAWRDGEYTEALALHRFAACADDTDDGLVTGYVSACSLRDRADEGLEFLRGRWRRDHAKSAAPTIALFRALEAADRKDAGLAILDAAIAARPADGELMLFAAKSVASTGDHDRAATLVAAAEGRARAAEVHATWAHLAQLRGDRAVALAAWREAAAGNPLDQGAHRRVAQCLSEDVGHGASLDYLRSVVAAHPTHNDLLGLLAQQLGEDAPTEAVAVLRRALEIEPHDGWTLRELALRLLDVHALDDALASAKMAQRIEPHVASSHGIVAMVLNRLDLHVEAMDAWRASLRCSPDHTSALNAAMQAARSQRERVDLLGFMHDLLMQRTTEGDGVRSYAHHARHLLDDDVRAAALHALLRRSAGASACHAAWIEFLLQQQRLGEARQAADDAVARFPFVARVWVDRARVARACRDQDGETHALGRALVLDPGWYLAVDLAVQAHRRGGDLGAAQQIAARAALQRPRDDRLRRVLAELALARGDATMALAEATVAVRSDPADDANWDLLRRCAGTAGASLVLDTARRLAAAEPDAVALQLALAERLNDLDDAAARDEAIAVLTRAIARAPHAEAAYEALATSYALAGRFAEAMRTCNALPTEVPPVILRGRAAWLLAEQGDLEGAVDAMRATLTMHPVYSWGWFRLADWLERLDRPDEELAACRSAVDHLPRSAVAHGYLGEALRKRGDATARQAFARAFDLDPTYRFAAERWFAALVAESDWQSATAMLDRWEPHVSAAELAMNRVEVAVGSGAGERAEALFVELCTSEDAPSWMVHRAAVLLREHGHARHVSATVGRVAANGAGNPGAAGVWVQEAAESRDWRAAARRLRSLEVGSAAWQEGAIEWLGAHAWAWRTSAVERLVRAHSRALSANAETWGTVGFALLPRPRRCVEWHGDWRQRSDVEPWMLNNLQIALRDLGRADEARDVLDAAWRLPADVARHEIVAWMALDALLARDDARAEREVGQVAPSADPEDVPAQMLAALVRSALAVARAPRDEAAAREARTRLRYALRRVRSTWPSRAHRALARAVLQRIASDSGTWRMRLWARLQQVRTYTWRRPRFGAREAYRDPYG